MSTIFSASHKKVVPSESNPACRILVLYEDNSARIKAMQMCERLVSQFSDDIIFDFSWLKFQRLSDCELASRAAETAKLSDVIMFCTHGGDLPREAIAWLETLRPAKNAIKRAIALLYSEPFNPLASLGILRNRLERIASRLDMDFLPLVLPVANGFEHASPQPFPIPAPSYNRNPENLQDHWGLND